jgi:2-oxo-4-hydroxy-4-carboxy-5-ureidoimidazoline decarboxylase
MTDPLIESLIDVTAFDRLSPMAAGTMLTPVCASNAWIVAMVALRPHGSLELLSTRSDEALELMEWSDVLQALDAHPRIGDRVTGTGQEALWSRAEQSGAAAVAADVEAALRAGNVEYEQRFGHVFLICATGRSANQMLAALRERLANDETAEQAVVRAELTAIVRLRLAKTFR